MTWFLSVVGLFEGWKITAKQLHPIIFVPWHFNIFYKHVWCFHSHSSELRLAWSEHHMYIYSVEQIVWVVFAQALSAIKTATRVDALCSREMWPKMYREPKRQNLWECNLYKLCHPARTTTEVTKIEMGNAIWFMNSHMLLILHRTDSSLRLHINNSLPKL